MNKSNQTKAQGYEGLLLRILVAIFILALAGFVCNFGMRQIVELNSQPEGVVDGNLTPCGRSDVCLSSELPATDERYIAPIALNVSDDVAITTLEAVLPRLPNASIRQQEAGYFLVRIGNIFSNRISDLEVYVNERQGDIQIKLEPFGTNAPTDWTHRQIERLRTLYEQELP